MPKKIKQIVDIKDLEYELRMLLGAAKIQKLLSTEAPGNLENYLKDSIYIHARNLYNFFTQPPSGNDSSITQFNDLKIPSRLYPKPWKIGLNTNVMHISDSRMKSFNTHNGKNINEFVQDFANDIERMWLIWINDTKDVQLKIRLRESLDRAQKESQNDLTYAKDRIK